MQESNTQNREEQRSNLSLEDALAECLQIAANRGRLIQEQQTKSPRKTKTARRATVRHLGQGKHRVKTAASAGICIIDDARDVSRPL